MCDLIINNRQKRIQGLAQGGGRIPNFARFPSLYRPFSQNLEYPPTAAPPPEYAPDNRGIEVVVYGSNTEKERKSKAILVYEKRN